MTYAPELRQWRDATGGDNLSLAAWADLRKRLLLEECKELCTAIDVYVETGDAHPMAKEAADVEYVLHGAMLRPGINLDAAFHAVHRSNLTKIGPDGRCTTRPDGKVLKGPYYQPPDMSVAFSWPEEHWVLNMLDKIEQGIRALPLYTRLAIIVLFGGALLMFITALSYTLAGGR